MSNLQTPEAPVSTPPPLMDAKEIESGKVMALLCYIPIAPVNLIVAIVCLVTANNSFSIYHAKQALTLMIILFAGYVVCIPLCFILIGIPLIMVLGLGGLVLMILGLINAASGKVAPLPILGGFAEKIFHGVTKKA